MTSQLKNICNGALSAFLTMGGLHRFARYSGLLLNIRDKRVFCSGKIDFESALLWNTHDIFF